jgi:ArsR family transcriptional regulator
MREVLDMFKAAGDENRVRILFMLKIRPLCVCEIEEVLDIALSTVSQHLRFMKYAGLIRDTREGRWIIYRLAEGNTHLVQLMELLDKLLGNDAGIQADRRKVAALDRAACAVRFRKRRKKEPLES